jgi:hypothetical protein
MGYTQFVSSQWAHTSRECEGSARKSATGRAIYTVVLYANTVGQGIILDVVCIESYLVVGVDILFYERSSST